MSSERQREANRRNGRKGGPKTIEGKERSRVNSLKHGLTSSILVVLPDEDRNEYNELLRGFRDSFQPQDAAEDALVVRLAQAHWRGLRSRAIETGMLDTSANLQRREARRIVENCRENLNPHEAIGVGFMIMPAERWQMYLRYDTTISREFFKTLAALTKLQSVRQRQARAASSLPPQTMSLPEPPPLVFTAGAGAQLSDSGIRSVSQNAASSVSSQPAPAGPDRRMAGQPRGTRTRQGVRPVTHSIPDSSDRFSRRRFRRLAAAAQVLPRIARRANQGNKSTPATLTVPHPAALSARPELML
jgi:hypothetical protein